MGLYYLQRDGILGSKQRSLLGASHSGWTAGAEYGPGARRGCHPFRFLGLGSGFEVSILRCALCQFLGMVLGGIFVLPWLSFSCPPRILGCTMAFSPAGFDHRTRGR